MKKIVK
jgi:hypothetical protein